MPPETLAAGFGHHIGAALYLRSDLKSSDRQAACKAGFPLLRYIESLFRGEVATHFIGQKSLSISVKLDTNPTVKIRP